MQLTSNINVDGPIYINVCYDNKFFRAYDLRENLVKMFDTTDVYLSEISIFFKYMDSIGLKVFLINTEPNHTILLNEDDLNFFKNLKKNDYLNTILTNNWLNIQQMQISDLTTIFNNHYFESLLIISHIDKYNKYYFDILIAVKNNLDLNLLKQINFKVIKIKEILEIKPEFITYNFFKKLLNFGELSSYYFKELKLIKYDEMLEENLSRSKSNFSKECQNFKNYKDKQLQLFNKYDWDLQKENDPIYYYYENSSIAKEFEFYCENYYYHLQQAFSQFGWTWITLDYEWKDKYNYNDIYKNEYTYPINESFLLVGTIFHEPKCVNNVCIEFEDFLKNLNIQDYDYGCMFDIIFDCLSNPTLSNPPYGYSIHSYYISTKILKYGTNYKTYYDEKIKNIK